LGRFTTDWYVAFLPGGLAATMPSASSWTGDARPRLVAPAGAIDYVLDNSALTETNVTNEVDRYIAWPGQALACKMGELKLRVLCTRAETALGDAFDLRDVHDAVLRNSALPLPLLEQQIEDYVGKSTD